MAQRLAKNSEGKVLDPTERMLVGYVITCMGSAMECLANGEFVAVGRWSKMAEEAAGKIEDAQHRMQAQELVAKVVNEAIRLERIHDSARRQRDDAAITLLQHFLGDQAWCEARGEEEVEALRKRYDRIQARRQRAGGGKRV